MTLSAEERLTIKGAGFSSARISYWERRGGRPTKRAVIHLKEVHGIDISEKFNIPLDDPEGGIMRPKFGGEIIIDPEDYERVNKFNWNINKKDGYVSAVDRDRKCTVYLHRLINKTPAHLETDHINRDKLDNRKCNLRSVTPKENMANRSAAKK